jgi:hypothetical protein
MQGRRIWVGGVGTALGVIGAALAGLGASALVWTILLVVGCALFAYALVVGDDAPEPASLEMTGVHIGHGSAIQASDQSVVSASQDTQAEGGAGDGDVRGNVFGPNATVSIDRSVRTSEGPDPLAGKRRLRKSIADLKAECLDKTTVRREQILNPHIGAWMRTSAVVSDVSPSTTEGHHKVLAYMGRTAEDRGHLLALEFAADHQDGLTALDRGEEIEIVGQLKDLEPIYVGLINCQLLDD